MTEPVALRVKEFCRLYGVGRTTAYELAKKGEIAMVRYSGLRRTVVTVESAKRWHASQQIERPPPKSSLPEHRVWQGMLARCSNPNLRYFECYGGRGIKVCDRWSVFDNFYADMGPRPTAKHQIDRYPNNDGDYEPGNCRWATAKEQAANRRRRRTHVRSHVRATEQP